MGGVKGALLNQFWINELFGFIGLLVGGVVEAVGGVGLAVEVDGVVAVLLALAELETIC